MPSALGQLEDLGEWFCLRGNLWNRRFGGSPSRLCFRYTLLMHKCFQCLAGKAYKCPVAIVEQVFDNLIEVTARIFSTGLACSPATLRDFFGKKLSLVKGGVYHATSQTLEVHFLGAGPKNRSYASQERLLKNLSNQSHWLSLKAISQTAAPPKAFRSFVESLSQIDMRSAVLINPSDRNAAVSSMPRFTVAPSRARRPACTIPLSSRMARSNDVSVDETSVTMSGPVA